jgi:3-deoxy-D-manno-octulosonic-acid transferase
MIDGHKATSPWLEQLVIGHQAIRWLCLTRLQKACCTGRYTPATMRWLLDLLYLTVAVLTAPIWLVRMVRTGKIRTDWAGRFGRIRADLPPKASPKGGVPTPGLRQRVLLHAVSVGEVNAIRELVAMLAGPGPDVPMEIVVATTTDTGFARAQTLWGQATSCAQDSAGVQPAGRPIAVVRYPFDFSFAVDRFLGAIDPDVVVLVELEVWPNFTDACRRRNIPVGVVNGRLTERSFRRYRKVRWLMRHAFARLAFATVQNEAYAARFREMGAPSDRVVVTGTMKWDTAQIAHEVAGAEELARAMGIDRTRPLIVAGSTAPGEHELLHAATPPDVQLLCAPRKPEWFDDAAAALPGCIRRSETTSTNPKAKIQNPKSSDRFLLDTIGELRLAYALADVVIIGRSFGDLHGSDMMEPVALSKAVIVGPAVSDFQDTVDALLAGGGIVQTTAEALPDAIRELLNDPERRRELAERGRSVIRSHQGATARNAEIVRAALSRQNQNPPPRINRDGGGGERRKAVE